MPKIEGGVIDTPQLVSTSFGPRLWDYTCSLFQHPKIRPTVNMAHIKAHYFGSHPRLNPSGIVPIGPVLDLDAPVRSLNS